MPTKYQRPAPCGNQRHHPTDIVAGYRLAIYHGSCVGFVLSQDQGAPCDLTPHRTHALLILHRTYASKNSVVISALDLS